MLTFDERALQRRLEQLPLPCRVAFAASCTQRLARACHNFAAAGGRSACAAAFDKALAYVWGHILETPQGAAIDRMLAELMEQIPDQDAPGWTPSRAFGDDALSAVMFCLQCLKSGEAQQAVFAARRVYEALDCAVATRMSSNTARQTPDSEILHDPAIQLEMARQARDLADLDGTRGVLSHELLEVLRQRTISEQAL